jgi:hypothetical protein
VVGDRLAITKGGTQLTFVKEWSTPVATALVGSWQLNTIAYGAGSSGGGKTPTTTVTMTLDRRGNYRISYRCGGKWGKALVEQTTIRFADSTYGGSDCGLMPGESADQHRVNAVLSGTASWSLRGRQLTITRSGYRLTFDKVS